MTLPPVLLLPGMMLDGRLYAGQVKPLSKITQVSVADLGSAATIEEMAEETLRRAPRQFALVGLSMGGIVALEIWRQARERITHMALLDTTASADRPENQRLRLAQIEAAERGELGRVMMDELQPRYLSKRQRRDESLLTLILEMALALGPSVFRRQSLALRDRIDRTHLLPTVDCPALVLCGREDQLCTQQKHVDMAAAIPHADLLVLSDCGHLSPLERPRAVSAAIIELLERGA